jgi:DMSO/TMAO reductase YedYZ molybdopterin-dependent catalytic subunit
MNGRFTRRDILKTTCAGIIGVTAAGESVSSAITRKAEAAAEADKHELLMKGTVNFKGFTAKEITPADEFYITSYSSRVPDIDENKFSLSIKGLVKKPYTLRMKDIREMKDKAEFVTLECIGNPVGGDAIGNALWEGVTLRKIIEKAAPGKGIVKTVFYAEDGYTDSIPYELSLSSDVFLAFNMNGKPLPQQHGHPLRAVVPGIYGMKNVKWISGIELVDYDYKGYWEKKGWSDEAVIPVKSQVLMPMNGKTIPPGPYVVGGVAFAGRYGISRVQVSFDDGDTWHDAEVKEPLSRWAWALWRFDWVPPKEGSYTVTVRAFDKAGKAQEEGSFLSISFPDGAKGYHSVKVKVRAG